MPLLPVEGDRSIYYEHHRGDGRPVVLVHAWGMTGRLWDRVTQELVEDGHAVVVLDHRGCGRSDKDFEDLAIATLGSDVVKLVEHLGLEGPVSTAGRPAARSSRTRPASSATVSAVWC